MQELHMLGLIFGNEPDATILAKGLVVLQDLGAGGDNDAWHGHLLCLVKISRGELRQATRRVRSVFETQLSFGCGLLEEAKEEDNEKGLRKLALASPARLPTERKGKRCSRRELASNEQELAQAQHCSCMDRGIPPPHRHPSNSCIPRIMLRTRAHQTR